MYTVYAFCRAIDSAVDDPPAGTHPHKELNQWRKEVATAYTGTPTFPVTISLAAHLGQIDIPEEYFQELIAGVEMDLTNNRYATFNDLYPYCYRVASVVGLICLRIFGTRALQAMDYAVNMGLAFQLTNILRDISRDADRGRIYLPQEDLVHFGYTEEDLFAHRYSQEFVELMKFQCARARGYYLKAQQILHALPLCDRRTLVVAEIMRGVYSRILDQIESFKYQVFESRISLTPIHRLRIATIIWLRSLFLAR
jgi:phytoene synthase